MAEEHASEFASIVASYLRKHGFAKTLSAFLRENDGTVQETDIVDLETLYQLHISTHANGASKTKKSKKAKVEDGLGIAKGDEDVGDDGEEKALSNLYVNGGTLSEKKKKKKGERENVAVDPPIVSEDVRDEAVEKALSNFYVNGGTSSEKKKKKKGERANVAVDPAIVSEVDKTGSGKAEAKMTPKEKKDSKKKRKEEKLVKDDVIIEGLEAKDDQDGGGLATQQEVPHFEKSPNKKSKKERKEQAVEQSPGTETPNLKETRPVDILQVLSQEDGLSKKKRKKSKDAGGPNTGKEKTNDIAESVSEVPISMQAEQGNATRQPVELSRDPEGCETGSKKKRRRKELSSEANCDVNGSSQEPFDAKLDATKNDEGNIDSKKQCGKKRKSKEDTTPVSEISNQEYNSLNTSAEKTKESGEGEGVNDKNVEMHESGSSKTPNNKKTPTGALAFKRVEVEKVSFADPRLGDNSYWAKDGADEGYGAKAQEVLGLVRGRDFRHEKTKKKRGSYRGGLIGLQSHSIKFENSDED